MFDFATKRTQLSRLVQGNKQWRGLCGCYSWSQGFTSVKVQLCNIKSQITARYYLRYRLHDQTRSLFDKAVNTEREETLNQSNSLVYTTYLDYTGLITKSAALYLHFQVQVNYKTRKLQIMT